jgi:hypothetical protein
MFRKTITKAYRSGTEHGSATSKTRLPYIAFKVSTNYNLLAYFIINWIK